MMKDHVHDESSKILRGPIKYKSAEAGITPYLFPHPCAAALRDLTMDHLPRKTDNEQEYQRQVVENVLRPVGDACRQDSKAT